ncbi:MAG TPA: secondary thiamine-phosphate synthase enzyme YjbQ [Acidimicrobiales bacterium]|nr:secondary thiamine-phosphate synthase enzyme YjbQ [Acidimicrobiales bacterium]
MERLDLDIDTTGRELVDLTSSVAEFVTGHGDGLVCVFVPHATAGVALFETGAGTEPDVAELLDRLLPRDHRYVHRHGSPGHGADHVLPLVVAPSVTIPVAGGRLELGTWQSIVLVDRNHDNPRRTVNLRLLNG